MFNKIIFWESQQNEKLEYLIQVSVIILDLKIQLLKSTVLKVCEKKNQIKFMFNQRVINFNILEEFVVFF